MSLLLKDRVWSMEAPTAKRGVYPLHGFKLGLYRLPIVLEEPNEIKSVHDGLKKAFEMDMYADRIYATYRWKEQNMEDPDEKGYEEVDLSVTVEIVTGEVVDIIYQVFPIEKFGDPNWVKDYRKKADHFAKMVIDTKDKAQASKIQGLDIQVFDTKIKMQNKMAEEALAGFILKQLKL